MPAFEDLLEYISALEIIDTHEHLPNESEWAAFERDVLGEWFSAYASSDLVSAGLPVATLAEIVDAARPLRERWRLIEPYWRATRNTAYARILETAAGDLYGVTAINAETIQEINDQFLERRSQTANGKASYYEHVLKRQCRIKLALVDRLSDPYAEADSRFFRTVVRLEGLIDLFDAEKLRRLSREVGFAIHTLDDFTAAVDAVIERELARGAVALKCPLAYRRRILFPKTPRREAQEQFNAIFSYPGGPDVTQVGNPPFQLLENYMMHHALGFAARRGLPVQVHTGAQEGFGNYVSNSKPEFLTNLFLEYGSVPFDVLHMSWPYHNVLSALAKNFANVFIDMCVAPAFATESATRALVEFLDSVPANKISAFGGDYLFPDGVYGHLVETRRSVARALSMKITDGAFDLDRAKEIATWLFVENPKRIFRLTDYVR